MKLLLLAIVCLLAFGCIATDTDNESNPETNATEPVLQENKNNETLSEPQAVNDSEKTGTNDTAEVITSETIYPQEPVFDFNYTDENGTLRVFFLHSPGCSACRDTYPIIEELEGKFPEVDFINYSLATQNGSKAYVKFAELHNLSTKKQMVPQALVNGTIITDRFNIEERLEPLLENLTK